MSLSHLNNGVDLSLNERNRHDHQIPHITYYSPFTSPSLNHHSHHYPRFAEQELSPLEYPNFNLAESNAQSSYEIEPFPNPRNSWIPDSDLSESPYGSVSSSAVSPTFISPPSSYGSPMPVFDMPMLWSSTLGSSSSMETESDGVGKNIHRCHVCQRSFENSKDLDRHCKISSHKAYRCPQPQCQKSYSRRDVYLRHKAAHKSGGHECPHCSRISKRRDHYLQHLKSCHSDKDDQTSNNDSLSEKSYSEQAQSFQNLVTLICDDPNLEYGMSEDSVATDEHAEEQKRKMRDVVRSLGDLLGSRNPALIGRLSNSVERMDGSNMEQLAEDMAGVAVLRADLSAVKAGPSPSSLVSVSRA